MINIKFATRGSQVEVTSGQWAGNKTVIVAAKDANAEGGFDLFLVNIVDADGQQSLVQVKREELTLIKI
ncbi:hypothetical protein D3C80_1160200 [compost metagenome]